MIDRLHAWAAGRDDVHAVVLVGSAVRAPDAWGDVDVLVVTDDVEGVLKDSRGAFSDAVIMFVDPGPIEAVHACV